MPAAPGSAAASLADKGPAVRAGEDFVGCRRNSALTGRRPRSPLAGSDRCSTSTGPAPAAAAPRRRPRPRRGNRSPRPAAIAPPGPQRYQPGRAQPRIAGRYRIDPAIAGAADSRDSPDGSRGGRRELRRDAPHRFRRAAPGQRRPSGRSRRRHAGGARAADDLHRSRRQGRGSRSAAMAAPFAAFRSIHCFSPSSMAELCPAPIVEPRGRWPSCRSSAKRGTGRPRGLVARASLAAENLNGSSAGNGGVGR